MEVSRLPPQGKLQTDRTGHVLEVVGEGGVGRELAGDAAAAALQRGDAVAPEPRSQAELPEVRRIDRRGLDLADEVLLARDGGRGDLLHAIAQRVTLAAVDERAHRGRELRSRSSVSHSMVWSEQMEVQTGYALLALFNEVGMTWP